jgi:hypothetical protein
MHEARGERATRLARSRRRLLDATFLFYADRTRTLRIQGGLR